MSYRYNSFRKVVLLGESDVGKTALLHQFINKSFRDYKWTTEADYWGQDIVLSHNRTVSLHIWESTGLEKFLTMRTNFYQGADCCILVFDVTNRNSFNSLSSWYDECLTQVNSLHPEHFPFVLLGNKVDLDNHQVTTLQAQEWCQSKNNIPYYETSDVYVEMAFQTFIKNSLDQPLNYHNNNNNNI